MALEDVIWGVNEIENKLKEANFPSNLINEKLTLNTFYNNSKPANVIAVKQNTDGTGVQELAQLPFDLLNTYAQGSPYGKMILPFNYSSNTILIVFREELHLLWGVNHWKWDGEVWTKLVNNPYNIYFGRQCAVVYHNALHILGGSATDSNDLYDHWVYDGTSWNKVGVQIPYPFYGGSAAVLGDNIHIFGCSHDTSYMKKHCIFNGTSWTNTTNCPYYAKYGMNYIAVKDETIHITVMSNDDTNFYYYQWKDDSRWTQYTTGDYRYYRAIIYNNSLYYDRFYGSAGYGLTTDNSQGTNPPFTYGLQWLVNYKNVLYVFYSGKTQFYKWEPSYSKTWDKISQRLMNNSFSSAGSGRANNGTNYNSVNVSYDSSYYLASFVEYHNELHLFGRTYHYKLNSSGGWTSVSTIPFTFSGYAYVLNDQIHLFGNSYTTGTASTYHYAWDGNNWVKKGNLPSYISNTLGWSIIKDSNNNLYCFGGGFNGNNARNYAAIDPQNAYGNCSESNGVYGKQMYVSKDLGETWSVLRKLPNDFYFYGGKSYIFNDEIYLWGSKNAICGYTNETEGSASAPNSSYVNNGSTYRRTFYYDLYKYSIKDNSWTRIYREDSPYKNCPALNNWSRCPIIEYHGKLHLIYNNYHWISKDGVNWRLLQYLQYGQTESANNQCVFIYNDKLMWAYSSSHYESVPAIYYWIEDSENYKSCNTWQGDEYKSLPFYCIPNSKGTSRNSSVFIYNNKINAIMNNYQDSNYQPTYKDYYSHYSWSGEDKNNWDFISMLPYSIQGRSQVRFLTFNNELYAFGGYSDYTDGVYSSNPTYQHSSQKYTYYSTAVNSYFWSYYNTYRFVHRFNKSTKNWEIIGVTPFSATGANVVVYNNQIHLFGSETSTYYKSHYVSSNGSSWTQASTLPISYIGYYSTSVVYKDEIHLFGGDSNYAYHYVWRNTDADDTQERYWVKLNNGPHSYFSSGSVCVVQDKMYTCYDKNIWVYDDANDTWSKIVATPFTWESNHINMVSYNDELYVLDGWNFAKFDGEKWMPPDKDYTPFVDGNIALANDKIRIIGGKYTSIQNKVYDYDTDFYSPSDDLDYGFYGGQTAVLNNGTNETIYLLGNKVENGKYKKFINAIVEEPDPEDSSQTITNNYRIASVAGLTEEEDITNYINDSSQGLDFMDGRAVVMNNEIHFFKNTKHYIIGFTKENEEVIYNYTTKNDLPYNSEGSFIINVDGVLHLLGGSSVQYARCHYIYDEERDAWEKIRDLSENFTDGKAVVVNGEIHLLYGFSHVRLWQNVVPIKDTASLPYMLGDANIIFYNNEIHVFGGDTSNRHYKIYDIGPDLMPTPKDELKFYVY